MKNSSTDTDQHKEAVTNSPTVERLIWIHLAVNFALPIYAVMYLFFQGAERELSDMGQGLTLFFLVVIVLNGFFQLISNKYQRQTPRQLLLGLLVPMAYVGLAAVVWKASPSWYLYEMGVLYGLGLMVAYFGIVFIRPFASGAIFRWPWSEIKWYMIASGLQLLLLVPALAASFGLLELIVLEYRFQADAISSGFGLTPRLIWFAAALIQLAFHEYAWLNRAAPQLNLPRG